MNCHRIRPIAQSGLIGIHVMGRLVASRIIEDGGFSKIEARSVATSHIQITFGGELAGCLVQFRDNFNGVHLLHNAENIMLEKVIV